METLDHFAKDCSTEVVRQNLGRIKLISVAGPLLCDDRQRSRVLRLLENRRNWGIPNPLIMLAVHNEREECAANEFTSGPASELAQFATKRQRGHNESVGQAIELFRQ